MELARSAGHREDRDLITGRPFVWVGPGSSRLKPRPATIPDKKCEPIRPTSRDYGIPTVPEGETTRTSTTTIPQDPDRISHCELAQVGTLSTSPLRRHTHLQRVAPCIQADGGGGGVC
jgi:hypothetical protein